MATEPSTPPSFSPHRKYAVGLQVGLVIFLVLTVVVMVNYLSHEIFWQVDLSSRASPPLSSRTTRFLHSITNHVRVTLYYSKDEPLYGMVYDLLRKYQAANPRISVRTVDYLRDPAAAQKLRSDYANHKLGGDADKNLIIFDCDGRVSVVPGDVLGQYTLEQTSSQKEPFRRKLVAFEGEKLVTAKLIALTDPKPLKAYFLSGHGEHRIDSGDELTGYLQFASVVQQNYVQVDTLSLGGTNTVPTDCNLLIIPGPTSSLLEEELQKIEQYLNQGGRLLALFNSEALGRKTGLEAVLAKWGVGVGSYVVVDPDHTISGSEVIVSAFSKHPVVNPLLNSGIYFIRPRAVGKLPADAQPADAPQVEEVAFTGTNAFLYNNPAIRPRTIPLVATVEKGAIKGVTTERGTTRMVIVGDSSLLGNRQLDLMGNRDFAGYLINWLLDRTQLLEGLGPRPVNEYRLVMTHAQLESTQWILLGAMPGAILLLGFAVYLRRRH